MYKLTTYMLFSNLIMHNFLYYINVVYFLLLLQTAICKPIF